MGKISQTASKYIIHAVINIEGMVNRPDVVGAVFGQTEGLLGSELELRELQRSGRIGRIDVELENKAGKTLGKISIPSSLDKAETALIGAAVEVIQRIGPCNAKIFIEAIEDVRVSKRNFVIKRAKELLKKMIDDVMPDSAELADEVTKSVRVMEIVSFGKDKLAAGPGVAESEDIIIVEGRADVLNLLKYGFKNAIAVNGTSVPQTVIELSKQKSVTVFVDGDRGGKSIIKELFAVAQLDYISMAPDGKEVEELTKKEIHQALRGKISAEQAKLELFGPKSSFNSTRSRNNIRDSKITITKRTSTTDSRKTDSRRTDSRTSGRFDARRREPVRSTYSKPQLNDSEKSSFKGLLGDLIGTKGAYVLNEKLDILGKVPIKELGSTLKNLGQAYAIVLDGEIDKDLTQVAEKAAVKYAVGMSSKVKSTETRIAVLTGEDF